MADIYTIFTRPISGTLGVTGSIYLPADQRLFGTASNAITSSFAITASYSVSSSFSPSASVAISSSYAISSSVAISSSFSTTSSYSVSSSISVSASFATTSSNSVTSSYAVSSSTAISSSFSPYNGLRTKAGNVVNTSFAGNPKKATVTFTTAFPNTSYAVVVTGEDARSWTIESKAVGSFVINANSNTALAGTTYWTAMAYGET